MGEDSSLMISSMVLEWKNGPTNPNSQENLCKAGKTVMGNMSGRTDLCMKASGGITKLMVPASTSVGTSAAMRENGRRQRCMVVVATSGATEGATKANTSGTKRRALASSHGPMGEGTRDIGETASSTVLVVLLMLPDSRAFVVGRLAFVLLGLEKQRGLWKNVISSR